MKEKIVFFGSGPYVVPILEKLKESFDLILVFTTEEEKLTNKRFGPVFSFCRENNIETTSLYQFEAGNILELESSKANVAILASFGLFIPNEVLNLFPLGIINIHPSLLPLYRGPTPIQTALLNGETKTGVSIMKLDSEIDHGPILGQATLAIEPQDNAETLYKKSFKIGAEILVDLLPKYISGDLKPNEQDHSKATFTEHLTRESGLIDINSKELELGNWKLELDRRIRAFYPWPGVWFKYQCHPEQSEGSRLNNKTIKLLPEARIQVEGKNPMSLKDFKNGYPEGEEILSKLNLSFK